MNIIETIGKESREVIISQVCRILEKNPEKNVDKLFSVIKALSRNTESKDAIESIEKYYNEVPSIKEEINHILSKIGRAHV